MKSLFLVPISASLTGGYRWDSSFLLRGYLAFQDSYLVDSASSHMLVSKIKPCMSKYKQFVRWNCEWLIKSVIVYLIVPYYMDTCGNSRANTCLKPRLPEGVYLLDKKPMPFGAPWWLIITYRIAWPCAGDGSFKFLPYQLSMVG